jgi:hypothetical protein
MIIRTCNSNETGNGYGIFVAKPISKEQKRVGGHIMMNFKKRNCGDGMWMELAEVFTAVSIYWDTIKCSLVNGYKRFGVSCYTESHPRRPLSWLRIVSNFGFCYQTIT